MPARFFVLIIILNLISAVQSLGYSLSEGGVATTNNAGSTHNTRLGLMVFVKGNWVKTVFKQSNDSNPTIVLPEKDGTLRLTAEKGKAIGPKIKYMPDWKAYGWFTALDQVVWLVKAKKGQYEVFLEWSVSDKEARKPFVLQVGEQTLTGTVATTGSWEVFKTEKIGTIRLRPGRKKVVFKPGSSFDTGALLDLREIKLVPGK